MAVIYKYPVPFGALTTVRNGNVVHFGKDGNGTMCVWVHHNDNDQTTTSFYVVGTGVRFSEDVIVHSSFVDENGFVWHLLEDWS